MSSDPYLHPDTLLPTSAEAGWSVGFVVGDGGVILHVAPNTPADRAVLVQESGPGAWQGKCNVGDQIIDVSGQSLSGLRKRDIAAMLRKSTMSDSSLLIKVMRKDKDPDLFGGIVGIRTYTINVSKSTMVETNKQSLPTNAQVLENQYMRAHDDVMVQRQKEMQKRQIELEQDLQRNMSKSEKREQERNKAFSLQLHQMQKQMEVMIQEIESRKLSESVLLREREELMQRCEKAEAHHTAMSGKVTDSEYKRFESQITQLQRALEESTEKLHAAEDACDAKEIELRRCTDQQAKAEQKAASALRRVQELEFAGSRGDQDKLIKSREDDLNLIRELQMKIEQVQSDNVEKTVLLNSVNERVNVAEEARQRLHDLVMELEVDARRLSAEKLQLSQQLAATRTNSVHVNGSGEGGSSNVAGRVSMDEVHVQLFFNVDARVVAGSQAQSFKVSVAQDVAAAIHGDHRKIRVIALEVNPVSVTVVLEEGVGKDGGRGEMEMAIDLKKQAGDEMSILRRGQQTCYTTDVRISKHVHDTRFSSPQGLLQFDKSVLQKPATSLQPHHTVGARKQAGHAEVAEFKSELTSPNMKSGPVTSALSSVGEREKEREAERARERERAIKAEVQREREVWARERKEEEAWEMEKKRERERDARVGGKGFLPPISPTSDESGGGVGEKNTVLSQVASGSYGNGKVGHAGFNTLDEFLNRPLEEFAPPSSTLPSAPKMSPGKELKLPASKLMSDSCSPNIFESPRDPGLFLKDTKEKQRSPSPVKNEVPSNVAALRARAEELDKELQWLCSEPTATKEQIPTPEDKQSNLAKNQPVQSRLLPKNSTYKESHRSQDLFDSDESDDDYDDLLFRGRAGGGGNGVGEVDVM